MVPTMIPRSPPLPPPRPLPPTPIPVNERSTLVPIGSATVDLRGAKAAASLAAARASFVEGVHGLRISSNVRWSIRQPGRMVSLVAR